ncbi:hypothetical protein HAX54_018457, partial [Datura stramonium]|nr:hypothetical protein [Datura stramonium]
LARWAWHHAAIAPCRASGHAGMLAPRAPHRATVPAHRAAGHVGVPVHCFGLVLALFIPSSSRLIQKPQIHPNPSLLALKASDHVR